MKSDYYPYFADDLAVRLTKESCQIRQLEAASQIVKLGGSAWLLLSALDGSRSVEEISRAISEQHDLPLEMIRTDLEEVLTELEERQVILGSETPVDADHGYLHLVGPSIRSSLHLDVTHHCNEICIHCLVPRDKQRARLEEIEDILHQGAKMGFVSVAYSGGEPTLHPHFWDLLEITRDLGFFVTIFTNGLTLNSEQIARLAGYKPDQIRISLYSMDPAIHDAITTVPGSHQRTKAAIEALHEMGARLYINCPVMTLNFEGFRQVAAFCKELGVERNLDPVIQPTRDRTKTYDDLQLSYAQAKEVTGFQQDADVLVVNVQPGAAVCNAGDDPSIDASLNIYPCPGLRLPLGNLKENSLEELLVDNAELRRVANLSLDDLEICQVCPVRDGCYRCHGHAYQDEGDYTKCAKMDRRQAAIRRELMIERGSLKD